MNLLPDKCFTDQLSEQLSVRTMPISHPPRQGFLGCHDYPWVKTGVAHPNTMLRGCLWGGGRNSTPEATHPPWKGYFPPNAPREDLTFLLLPEGTTTAGSKQSLQALGVGSSAGAHDVKVTAWIAMLLELEDRRREVEKANQNLSRTLYQTPLSPSELSLHPHTGQCHKSDRRCRRWKDSHSTKSTHTDTVNLHTYTLID